ncbi:MAG: hypothetical protein ACFBSC_15140 [Microcoleaceae cyanobacterium]
MSNINAQIDEIIKQHNPFTGNAVVRPPQIWGKGFPDVESINIHASNAVAEAVDKIRNQQLRIAGITLIGDKGTGKTQIISRIRHCFQRDGDTLFVYIGKYGDLNQIQYEFLQGLASSLRARGQYPDVTQWQEIAAHLINEAKELNCSPQTYIKKFPLILEKYSSKIINHFTSLILKKKPWIKNPYLVKAIIWTLAPHEISIYANHWLAGMEVTSTQAESLGLPQLQVKSTDAAFENVCQILDIVNEYKIPIICFDELDRTDINDHGYTTPQVITSFSKDLCNNMRKGIVMHTMYPMTWKEQVYSFGDRTEAIIDRIASYPEMRKPVELKQLNSDDVVAVVSHWLVGFYNNFDLEPPSSVYPFEEDELRKQGKEKPTVRDILNWCSKNWKIPDTSPLPDQDFADIAFSRELEDISQSVEEDMENSNKIAGALEFAFRSLIGETLSNTEVQDVEVFNIRNDYLNFKVIGQENGLVFKLGVAVNQQATGRGVQAALKRLVNYRRFDLTRGCLVRSKRISPNAKLAQRYIKQLLNEQGGEWVFLQAEDIKPLIAIQSVYENRESYELSEEDIFTFARKIASSNPLILEILSDPSGQEPDDLINDDIPISIPGMVKLESDVEDLESDLSSESQDCFDASDLDLVLH